MWGVIVLSLIGMGGLVSMGSFFWRRAREGFAQMEKELAEKEKWVQVRKERLQAKKEQNSLLGQHVSEIVAFYEWTKKVSVSLEFQEVFATLCEVMNTTFSFEKGYLFLLREEEGKEIVPQSIEEIYSLRGSPEASPPGGTPPKVGANAVPYAREVLEEAGRRKDAFRGKAHPFIAVPLWVKDRLISVLVCERLKEEELEKFAILSSQFALAIQKVRLYEKLQELAITDGLTRLHSRRYFLERFFEEVERSKRHSLHLSFLIADIDHFKQTNDQYGHLIGDVVLRDVATLLKENVREMDLVGRYGGEEFSIALPDTDVPDALQVAERIRKAVDEKRFTAYNEVTRVTLSVGVGAYPEDGEKVVDLIEAADRALYRAKQLGRNKVCAAAVTHER